MDRAQLKTNAKTNLGNSLFGSTWLMMLLAEFVATLIISAATGFTFGIVGILLAGPFGYGLAYMYLKLARVGGNVDFMDLFKGFKDDLGQTLLLGLLTDIFIFLWSLLLVIPGIVKYYAYSMVYFVKVDNPDYDWQQCINASKEMTQGHKGELFVLDLSFIGWFIVGSLVLGIGNLWVVPYQSASKAQFYEAMKPVAAQPQQPYQQPYQQPEQPQY